jgi:uncharacterized protein GlcG (DUF336 family)
MVIRAAKIYSSPIAQYLDCAANQENFYATIHQKAANLVYIPGFLLLGGGVPIKVGNEVIGAVGVGGPPGGNLDEQCAMVALDKIKDQLK